MKLKDFKKTYVFKTAEQVVYFNRNDEEIEITSEEQRRKLYNAEVIDHGTMIDGVITLEIYLDV